MTALLSGYSLWVAKRAVDDITRSSKFVPSVAEVNESCERYAPAKSTQTWVDGWEAAAKLQLENRARTEAPIDPDERQRIESGFKELLGHLRRETAPNPFTPAAVKAKYGLTDAQWDAIPNAKLGSTWATLGDAAE